MARKTSVSLNDHFADFIDEQVGKGAYSSPSDVVHAGLQLLEEYKAEIEALQLALIAGEQSGEPQPFSPEEFLARMKHKYGA